MLRLISLLALAVIVAVIAAVTILQRTPSSPAVQLDTGIAVDPPRQLKAFELIDHHQQPFDNERLQGRWTVAMIGFTHCPDICPTALNQLAIVKRQLAEQGGELDVLFVSVDPDRDRPEDLARYVGFFDDGLIGATGELEQLRRFADSLDFAWVRVPQSEGRYTVDHSGALALIDPRGRLAGYFLPPLDLPAIEADLGRVLAIRAD